MTAGRAVMQRQWRLAFYVVLCSIAGTLTLLYLALGVYTSAAELKTALAGRHAQVYSMQMGLLKTQD